MRKTDQAAPRAPTADVGSSHTLSAILRGATHDLHREAERSGLIAELLRGRVTASAYALFLRNLHPVYQQLERGLDRHREHAALRPFARREIYRADALAADLRALAGPHWPDTLALTSAGRYYTDRVAAAADGSGDRLLGHVYVRYFGDLNGGQILKRRLQLSADLPPGCLSFYEFADIEDMEAFLRSCRGALDEAADGIGNQREVVDAALEAFTLNIQLSREVQGAALDGPTDHA